MFLRIIPFVLLVTSVAASEVPRVSFDQLEKKIGAGLLDPMAYETWAEKKLGSHSGELSEEEVDMLKAYLNRLAQSAPRAVGYWEDQIFEKIQAGQSDPELRRIEAKRSAREAGLIQTMLFVRQRLGLEVDREILSLCDAGGPIETTTVGDLVLELEHLLNLHQSQRISLSEFEASYFRRRHMIWKAVYLMRLNR